MCPLPYPPIFSPPPPSIKNPPPFFFLTIKTPYVPLWPPFTTRDFLLEFKRVTRNNASFFQASKSFLYVPNTLKDIFDLVDFPFLLIFFSFWKFEQWFLGRIITTYNYPSPCCCICFLFQLCVCSLLQLNPMDPRLACHFILINYIEWLWRLKIQTRSGREHARL